MRMICALAILGLPVAAVAQPASGPAGRTTCRTPTPTPVSRADGVAQFKRLGDLPPANEVLALLRTEDGCPAPVIVRYRIGAGAASEQPGRPR